MSLLQDLRWDQSRKCPTEMSEVSSSSLLGPIKTGPTERSEDKVLLKRLREEEMWMERTGKKPIFYKSEMGRTWFFYNTFSVLMFTRLSLLGSWVDLWVPKVGDLSSILEKMWSNGMYLPSINLCLFLRNEFDAVGYQPWKQVKPLGHLIGPPKR